MKSITALVLSLMVSIASAQVNIIVKGDVKNATTGDPLAYATIGVRGRIVQTVSKADGTFELIVPGAYTDTLEVSYMGYKTFKKILSALAPVEHIELTEYATVLEEVSIVFQRLDVRDVDRNFRPVRGNLWAMTAEVTNIQYANFLAWLEKNGKSNLKAKHDFKVSKYPKSVQDFYKKYHTIGDPKHERRRSRQDSLHVFNRYPAVNISHEDAVAYCEWLTEQYNESPSKKKFKKVIFRLPTLDEWQITALGYDKFQSWKLLENEVEIIVAKDTTRFDKGEKKTVKVDDRILYPWYKFYHWQLRAHNQLGCYLGNFKIEKDRNCPARAQAFDGFSMQAPVTCYFPNDIGFYDVVGNVAEMIDENGKACGGSWNDAPERSTIQSVKNFSGYDETVGFRVFMEVIEK